MALTENVRRAASPRRSRRAGRAVDAGHRALARRRARLPLAQPRLRQLSESPSWPRPVDLSIFVQARGRQLRIWTSRSRASAAPAASARSKAASKRLPGIVEARLNFTNRRLGGRLARRCTRCRRGDRRARAASATTRIRSTPARAETDEARHARLAAEMPGGRGLRRDEHHAAVGVGVVRRRDMTQETRDFFHWLSALIALPAAAYAGQPFFQSALRAIRARQLNMDVPISLGVLLALGMSVVETAQSRPARLFRLRHHAAVLPAVRPLSRPRHAAQDARGRRQSRRAQGGGRAPLRRWRRGRARCRSRR